MPSSGPRRSAPTAGSRSRSISTRCSRSWTGSSRTGGPPLAPRDLPSLDSGSLGVPEPQHPPIRLDAQDGEVRGAEGEEPRVARREPDPPRGEDAEQVAVREQE